MAETIQNLHRKTPQVIKAGIERIVTHFQSMGFMEVLTIAAEKKVSFEVKTKTGLELRGTIILVADTVEILCDAHQMNDVPSQLFVQKFIEKIKKFFSV